MADHHKRPAVLASFCRLISPARSAASAAIACSSAVGVASAHAVCSTTFYLLAHPLLGRQSVIVHNGMPATWCAAHSIMIAAPQGLCRRAPPSRAKLQNKIPKLTNPAKSKGWHRTGSRSLSLWVDFS
eukprot:scaffold2182_cov118-Isochrysis_galbana.AAC.15